MTPTRPAPWGSQPLRYLGRTRGNPIQSREEPDPCGDPCWGVCLCWDTGRPRLRSFTLTHTCVSVCAANRVERVSVAAADPVSLHSRLNPASSLCACLCVLNTHIPNLGCFLYGLRQPHNEELGSVIDDCCCEAILCAVTHPSRGCTAHCTHSERASERGRSADTSSTGRDTQRLRLDGGF